MGLWTSGHFFPAVLPSLVHTSKMVDILTQHTQTLIPYGSPVSTTAGHFRNCWTLF